MKTDKRLIVTVAALVLASGQVYAQPTNNPDNSQQGSSPRYTVGNPNTAPAAPRENREQRRQQNQYQNREQRREHYDNRQRYDGPGGYNRGYPPPPGYGDRNYRRSDSKMPWESGRGGSRMPWESKRGGSRMPWESSRGGRDGWMSKDRFSDAWDDMLNKPSDMGEMPGGWTAPSVSMPNPVDVGDEFGDAARDAPEQMRDVYDENRRSNERYDNYRGPNRYR